MENRYIELTTRGGQLHFFSSHEVFRDDQGECRELHDLETLQLKIVYGLRDVAMSSTDKAKAAMLLLMDLHHILALAYVIYEWSRNTSVELSSGDPAEEKKEDENYNWINAESKR
ncbi:hypothetical protein Tco_0867892 [Tanacetum coccineum]